MAQLYRMNRNESLIQQTRDAVNMTYTYQGSASGTITADEYIGGNSPQRGFVKYPSHYLFTILTLF
jgi:hypothetical protein